MSLLERQVSPSSLVRSKSLDGILYCRHTAHLRFSVKDPLSPYRGPSYSLSLTFATYAITTCEVGSNFVNRLKSGEDDNHRERKVGSLLGDKFLRSFVTKRC